MNWLSKLINKSKTQIELEAELNILYRKQECLNEFTKGKELYQANQIEDALWCFDHAFKLGFEKYFSSEFPSIYEMRAICLQDLKFHFDAIKDFDMAIKYFPEDCNIYYMRSMSKSAIMDYIGEISDLEDAIKICKANTTLNRAYDKFAIEKGYQNGIEDIFEMSLLRSKMDLEMELEDEKRLNNAKTPEIKEFYQKIIHDRKTKILGKVKTRD